MRARFGRRGLALAVAMLAVLGIGAGIAVATIPNEDDSINACYKKVNGQLRVIDTGAGDECLPSEESLTLASEDTDTDTHVQFYVVSDIEGTTQGEALANNKTATAICEEGDIATGGGVELAGSTGGGTVPAFSEAEIANVLNIVQNRPRGGPDASTGWRGKAHETPYNANPAGQKGWEIRVTAICADIDGDGGP